MKRLISLSLSPNTQRDDVFLAIKMMFSPWLLFGTNYVKALEQWFRQFFSVSYAVSFNSGRSALLAVLKTAGVTKGDEVILQSFTCVAVPCVIISLGARPIYCDISSELTINPKELEFKISKKTKAIIIQHTFGMAASMASVKKIAREKNILVIEDCAHTIGGEFEKKKLGTFGDAAIFSFGRDKAFSSVFGGIALTNNKSIGIKLRSLQKNINNPSIFWIYQQLAHPLVFAIILPIYNLFSLGKILLVLAQRIRILSFPVFPEEKQGSFKNEFFKRMPNVLACLALRQLKKINIYNAKRKEFSTMYINNLQSARVVLPFKEEMPYLRFPVLVGKRNEYLNFLRKQGIYAGTWYSNVVDPKGTNFEKIFYTKGSCPNAEYVASKIINLPTNPTITKKDIQKVVDTFLAYDKNTGNNR